MTLFEKIDATIAVVAVAPVLIGLCGLFGSWPETYDGRKAARQAISGGVWGVAVLALCALAAAIERIWL